jgi:hypothetical protein
MLQHGDEAFIYAKAQQEAQSRDDKIQNDIKNGYIIMEDKHVPFSEREIIAGMLYMTMPSAFLLMPEELVKLKYLGEKGPDNIYTNEEGSINISFSFTGDMLKSEEIEEAKDSLQQVIVKMTPSGKIISSAIIEGEIRIGHFDFISPAVDGEVYNLMFLFSLYERFVLGTFNCMRSDMSGWQEAVGQMLHSIRNAAGKFLSGE